MSDIFVFKEAAKSPNDYNISAVDIDAELFEFTDMVFDSDFDFHNNVTDVYE